MNKEELILAAINARNMSYSPYSHYSVGAAVLAEDGKIYVGANIENASYGATVCAERTAIFASVLARNKKIQAIAIAGGDSKEETLTSYAYPCGMCRQVMTEFCQKDTVVIVAKSVIDYQEFTLDTLIPYAFEL